jgi:hypothetical protein
LGTHTVPNPALDVLNESELTARAEVVHAGRTIAITRATVASAEGKPVLLATGSTIYLPGRPASLGEVELSGHEDVQQGRRQS